MKRENDRGIIPEGKVTILHSYKPFQILCQVGEKWECRKHEARLKLGNANETILCQVMTVESSKNRAMVLLKSDTRVDPERIYLNPHDAIDMLCTELGCGTKGENCFLKR